MLAHIKHHWWKWSIGIILTPIVVVLLLGLALYIPKVQDWAKNIVEEKASEALGMKVHIEKLRLDYPLELSIEQILVEPAPKDTLLNIKHLEVSVLPVPLLSKQILIPHLGVEHLRYKQRDSLGTNTQVALKLADLHNLRLNLSEELASATELIADGLIVSYFSTDSTSKAESEPFKWKINLGKLALSNSLAQVRMPRDSIFVTTDINRLNVHQVSADLLPMRIELGASTLEEAGLKYSIDGQEGQGAYFDPQHISVHKLNIKLNKLISEGQNLDVYLRHGSLQERSGFTIESLQGIYQTNDLGMHLRKLSLKTQHSDIKGNIDIPWKIFQKDTTAILECNIDAAIALNEVENLIGRTISLPLNKKHTPQISKLLNQPLLVQGAILGTLNQMIISDTKLKWTNVFDLKLSGEVSHILNEQNRRGKIKLTADVEKEAESLLSFFGAEIEKSYRIPSKLNLDGTLDISRQHFDLNTRLRGNTGELSLDGLYNDRSKEYKADLNISGINIQDYLPLSPLKNIEATVNIKGHGFDPLSHKTRTNITARISSANYADAYLENITLDGKLKNGELNLMVNSFNPGLNASLLLDGLLSKKEIQTSIVLESEEIDFKKLGLSSAEMSTKFRLQGELRTDLKETHHLLADIRDMDLRFQGDTIRPKEVELTLHSNQTESKLALNSGDLRITALSQETLTQLTNRFDRLSTLSNDIIREIQSDKPMKLHLEDLGAALPNLNIDLEMGKNNALRPYLAQYRLAAESLEGHIRLGPSIGIDGHITARDLRSDTLRLNCIDMSLSSLRIPRINKAKQIASDSLRLILELKLDKLRFRNQAGFSFSTQINTSLQDAEIATTFRGNQGEIKHQLSLRSNWGDKDYNVHIPSETIILSGNRLEINKDNYITLNKSDLFFNASIFIRNLERGSSLKLLASKEGDNTQIGTLSILGLKLEDYKELGLPNMSGTLVGDINYLRSGSINKQPTVNGELSIQNLSYEEKELGHFATAFFYEPRNDNSHYITAEVSYKGKQALAINGVYAPQQKENKLKGEIELLDFPLELANPFSASFSTYLSGSLLGKAELSGTLSKPSLYGALSLNSAQVELREYASTLELDSIPLSLEGDKIRLNKYAIHSNVDAQHPIYLNGTIGIQGEHLLSTDLRLQAEETMFFNEATLKNEHQVLYGRLVTSADMRLTGKLNALKIRGQLSVDNGTNCTYVMKEASLDASDKSVGLIKFTDFADTLFVPQRPVETNLGGIDLNVGIRIEPSVRFNVDLSPDGKDHVKMQGGGNLQLRYLPYGEMRLRGKYEMRGGGSLQYTLPIVGNKTFAIDPRGYIAFDGDVRNPLVNLMASQKVRASTGESNGAKTNFLVSIKLKDKIDNINLSFDLSAPENLSLQNSLVAMTAEERGKQAIGLLATGTYLAGNNSGKNFKLNETFASLLENQINSLTGDLLRGTDLSIGMENDGTLQDQQTSYTYSFSRRFYNDRIRIVIGGKIHTGKNIANREQSLIDNVALEYQLDKAGERFIQLYHKRITDDVIEGEYSETGIGILLRRKLERIRDLFHFGKKKTNIPRDTVNRQSQIKEFSLPNR